MLTIFILIVNFITVIYSDPTPVANYCDWSNIPGAVSNPPQDQGRCDSCYSFAMKGAMEGAAFLANIPNLDLSAQQIFFKASGDCETVPKTQYLIDILKNPGDGGICANTDFPYTQSGGGTIGMIDRLSNLLCKPILKLTDAFAPHFCNAQSFAIAIATQPIYMTMYTTDSYFEYKHGLYNPLTKCDEILGYHAVLAVGYGQCIEGDNICIPSQVENNINYWKIKDSRNPSAWGYNGYMFIEDTDTSFYGTCGICNMLSQLVQVKTDANVKYEIENPGVIYKRCDEY